MTGSSKFIPGKKLPLLGISIQTANLWVRWGMPIGTGLLITLILWLIYT
jgi:hypothetical protein